MKYVYMSLIPIWTLMSCSQLYLTSRSMPLKTPWLMEEVPTVAVPMVVVLMVVVPTVVVPMAACMVQTRVLHAARFLPVMDLVGCKISSKPSITDIKNLLKILWKIVSTMGKIKLNLTCKIFLCLLAPWGFSICRQNYIKIWEKTRKYVCYVRFINCSTIQTPIVITYTTEAGRCLVIIIQ